MATRGVAALLLGPFLFLLSSCTSTSEDVDRVCDDQRPCPSGYACGADRRCHLVPGVADAGGGRDAEPGDTGSADAQDADPDGGEGPSDAALPDAMLPDAGGPFEVVVPVAASEDDAMEDPTGPMLVDYEWMSLYTPMHRGGFRFALPAPPARANLVDVRLRVYVDSSGEDDPRTEIYLEARSDPAAFSSADGDITARPKSAAMVLWSESGLGEGWSDSPSLFPLVGPVLADPGFMPGDHVVVLLVPTAAAGMEGVFELRQLDYGILRGGDYSPRLVLIYEES